MTSRIGRSFHSLLDTTDRWLTVTHRTGPNEIIAVYQNLLEGQADPAIGYIVSMSDSRRETQLV